MFELEPESMYHKYSNNKSFKIRKSMGDNSISYQMNINKKNNKNKLKQRKKKNNKNMFNLIFILTINKYV